MRARNGKLPLMEKNEILYKLHIGVAYKEILKKHDVSIQSLYHWKWCFAVKDKGIIEKRRDVINYLLKKGNSVAEVSRILGTSYYLINKLIDKP